MPAISSSPIRSPASEVSDSIRDEVRALRLQLSDSDPKVVSAAASRLGDFRYQEVVLSLIQTLEAELAKDRPNTWILGAAYESLAKVASSQFAAELDQLEATFQREKSRLSSSAIARNMTRVEAGHSTALQNARGSSSLVPKLFSDSLLSSRSRVGPAASPVSGNPSKTVTPSFERLLRDELIADPVIGSEVKVFLTGTSDFISDEVAEKEARGELVELIGREAESDAVIDTLARLKGKNPVLVGPAGAGKTTIAERVAQKILRREFPEQNAFKSELSNAVVIGTTPARISRLAKSDSASAQGDALETFFRAILAVEKKTGIPVIVYIDELHTLGPAQVEAMKPFLDSESRSIRLLGSTTSKEFQLAFKQNEAIVRRLQQIPVSEFSVEQALQILKKSWVPKIEKRYGIQFDEQALELVARQSTSVIPESGRIDSAVKVLQDISVKTLREGAPGKTVTARDVGEWIQERLGFPVDPRNPRALVDYERRLVNEIDSEVFGQERLVQDLVSQWVAVLQDRERPVRSIMVMGPTGVGKSKSGRALAKKVLPRSGAFFEIDATQFKEGGLSLNSLLGAPNGVISSDKTSGTLMEWLDDPARGKFGGVILINEPERAHRDLFEKIMEFMDVGQITGGDGKTRRANRHLVVFASNRGDSLLFPPEQIEKWSTKELFDRVASMKGDDLKSFWQRSISSGDEFKHFLPVLNRIDRYTAAAPVTEDVALRVVREVVEKRFLAETVKDYGIQIELDESLSKHFVETSRVRVNGARPLERSYDSFLKDLRNQLVFDGITADAVVRVSVHSTGEAVRELKVERNQKPLQLSRSPMIPRVEVRNPFKDPELQRLVRELEPVLNSRIIGQPEVTKSVAQAVISHRARRGRTTRPLSFFVIGSTGTGKTELGKALAEALYGSADRAVSFALGKVIYEGELNNVMGSPAGHVGSTKIAPFEQALMDHPEGAVLIMDEASNMGGKDLANKNQLFKKFYDLIDEGRWTSPATGHTYDLSKYIFEWTGNDSENLFQGLDSDDLRLTVWREHSERSRVRALMVQAGVPEAFVGRQADLILYRPLTQEGMQKISKQMVEKTLGFFAKQGLRVSVSDSFYVEFARAFFTQDQGARSVRNAVDYRLEAALTEFSIDLMSRGIAPEEVMIEIDLVNQGGRRVFRTRSSLSDSTVLELRARAKDRVLYSKSEDLTEFAAKRLRTEFSEALSTAFHEVGHVLGNDSASTGEKLAFVTIQAGSTKSGGFLGYARYERELRALGRNPTRRSVVDRLAAIYSGRIAQELAGFEKDAGWAGDLQQIRSLTRKYVVEWGMVPELEGVALDSQGSASRMSAAQAIAYDEAVSQLLQEAQTVARQRLQDRWPLMRQLVARLLKRGSLSGDEVERLSRQFSAAGSGIRPWLFSSGVMVRGGRAAVGGTGLSKSSSGSYPSGISPCETVFSRFTH
jgi:ATP-dependent Clp protease ATP-binding subunit ClpA